MKGCTFKRKLRSGKISWGYALDVGKDENGKRKQIYKTGFKREGDAQAELTRLLNEKNEGQLVKPAPTTFAAFMEEWFREHAERHCSAKTVERYRQMAKAYILPHIGHVSLPQISALMIERLLNRLRDSGGRGRKNSAERQLSVKTVRHIAGLIHVALGTAVRWKLIRLNPCDAVQLPKVERKEARVLDAEKLGWYLAVSRKYGLYEFLLMASATGCRRGELLALRWSDLDLHNGIARVSRSLEQTKSGLRIKGTKNDKPRLISLPPSALEALNSIKASQEKLRNGFGPDYRKDLNLVFANPNGDYLKPDSVTAKACLIARKAGLPGISLHTLRHSHGSQLLSAGVSLPAVSKRLGHSSVYVTATVYSHALSHDEIAAAEAWETAVSKLMHAGRDAAKQ